MISWLFGVLATKWSPSLAHDPVERVSELVVLVFHLRHDITVCELAAGIEAGVQQRPDQLVFALVVGGQPGAVPAGDLSGARWGS
jgi:hypothetical protein